ncbi:hypothetical protein AB0N28_04330 [Streptomyces sp. NPDC051130]|uniref:hypothetical protein n=1 Tax=Streptomyces sp. NPDC051130 TaxID=3157223 RepID=UPI0034300348
MKDLVETLDRRADFWDRPDGDWGAGVPEFDVTQEMRRHANSCYRMGSLALARQDWRFAERWLCRAMEADHPGAWFRFAALVCSRGAKVFGGDGHGAYVRYLVEGAAGFGHGDAQRMRPLLTNRSAALPPFTSWEDPDYGPDVLATLRSGLAEPPATP